MHIRYSTRTRNGQTFRYAQLVESYRRPKDGMPAVRVVSHLGRLPEATVDALRVALRAARLGEGLVLASEHTGALPAPTLANLRYLDLAVLRDGWLHWDLGALVEDLAGPSEAVLPFADAVLAMVLQRCVEPGSKLEAERWVPTTALPEILGFAPCAFEHTRIHRVLDALHAITDPLQQRLAEAYRERDGAFAALFMDVTDTYFEGIGSPKAELTRTKTEMPNKRCLSIVLLVNQRGYPLRWTVMGGKTKDWTAMGELVRQLKGVPWLEKTPIVFDRAMGNRSTVRELKEAGLHFLTAAHRDSIESYTSALPTAFDELELEGTDASYEADILRVAEAARQHPDFTEIHDRLFVVDLGVRELDIERPTTGDANPSQTAMRRRGAAHLLLQARAIREQMMACAPPLTQAAVAPLVGLSSGRIGQLLSLLRLSADVQQRVEEWGERLPATETQLRALLRLGPTEQLPALEALLARKAQDTPRHEPQPDPVGELRMVAYFNPQLFVDIRRRTDAHWADIQKRVKELNAELATVKRSRKRDTTYRKFAYEVERLHYLDIFDIAIEEITLESKAGATLTSFRGAIKRREDAWKRRRRYDGFVLLLAHPEISSSGIDLVQLYRSKDSVEKGFQTIKSVCKLRPIFHQTDPKVLAHVTLCMLGLLLQRTLEHRLGNTDIPMTATACVDALKTCHLNVRRPKGKLTFYDITVPTNEQRAILNTLKLSNLANEEHQRTRIVPRPLT